MSIESKVFGARNPTQNTNKEDRIPAKFWLNIGYSIDLMNTLTGEVETKFVSLPQGIPLDTMVRRDVSKGTPTFLAQATARNDLLDQILEVCATMKPGEDKIIGDTGDLQLQIHCVADAAEVVAPTDNPFRKRLTLAA